MLCEGTQGKKQGLLSSLFSTSKKALSYFKELIIS